MLTELIDYRITLHHRGRDIESSPNSGSLEESLANNHLMHKLQNTRLTSNLSAINAYCTVNFQNTQYLQLVRTVAVWMLCYMLAVALT